MPKANDPRPTTNGDQNRRSEQGYILLMLMLFVTLLAIAAAAVAPSIAFRVRRDREEEMIHRGTQYSRAIRRYVKKTGRYPTALRNWKTRTTSGSCESATRIPSPAKTSSCSTWERFNSPVQRASPGRLPSEVARFRAHRRWAGPLPTLRGRGQPAGYCWEERRTPVHPGELGLDNRGLRQAQQVRATQPIILVRARARPMRGRRTNPAINLRQFKTGPANSGAGSDKLSSAVFGGGPILGVASISKAQSIREFNHKNHYNQWQFIYDPTMDRGGLITTPAQPPLQRRRSDSAAEFHSTGQNPASPGGIGAQVFPWDLRLRHRPSPRRSSNKR